MRILDGHAKARFAGEYKAAGENTWGAASGCWLYLDKNDYWMITDNEIEVGPHSSRGHIHSKEKARGRAPTEMRAWVSNTGDKLGSKVWQDAPEILVDAAVRLSVLTKRLKLATETNQIKSNRFNFQHNS